MRNRLKIKNCMLNTYEVASVIDETPSTIDINRKFQPNFFRSFYCAKTIHLLNQIYTNDHHIKI